ncbi:major facilitator transporter [Robbsia andropogonis]|uniref:Major facilitator transporter n=1 Tax=Robbsia andropogonis TaxID=28092 RepID=A0A0F5JXE7_9BURK|nr:MFS transporter [Robbsia andropogonis]KKB62314.1 major facilitator transporter [Robbsia andropogonis]MCP1121175.1 MFS transporter [Robbsia andropogonis]MCP1130967.1 MFS transporter [Robbsia andropogonis]
MNDTIDTGTLDSAPSMLTRRQIQRAIVTSVIGNGLEWFDFLAYGYFAKTIANVFFPSANGFVSLALTLATFAIGFIVRPLGGVLFGLYADRCGRTRAMSVLIMMMATGTFLMGITPGYTSIGLAAPLIIVFARLIQGLAVGGQFATASAMLVEFAPPGKKMFYGSFNMASQALALLLSSGCGWLLTTGLSHDALIAWGWRVPFLLGSLVGPLGFYIRHRVDESPEFLALQAQSASHPRSKMTVGQFFRENGDAALCAMGVIIVGAATNYIWHSYIPVYAERELHLPLSSALVGAFVSGFMNLFLYPLAGKLADRFGGYRLFYPVVLCWAACVYPLFWFVVSAPSPGRLMFAQVVSTVFLAAMSGSHPGMLAMIFPVRSRSTGVALSYNIAVTLFGGLAPLSVATLINWTGSAMMPAFYIIFAAVVSLGLVHFTRTGKGALRVDQGHSIDFSAKTEIASR